MDGDYGVTVTVMMIMMTAVSYILDKPSDVRHAKFGKSTDLRH